LAAEGEAADEGQVYKQAVTDVIAIMAPAREWPIGKIGKGYEGASAQPETWRLAAGRQGQCRDGETSEAVADG
jgi:hypothetical protein